MNNDILGEVMERIDFLWKNCEKAQKDLILAISEIGLILAMLNNTGKVIFIIKKGFWGVGINKTNEATKLSLIYHRKCTDNHLPKQVQDISITNTTNRYIMTK